MKMSLMLHSINWSNFIVWLPLLLDMFTSQYMYYNCFPGCDVINFEINIIFLIKQSLYMTKSQDKNINILKTKQAFKMKKKTFSIIFKGLSAATIVSDLIVHLSAYKKENGPCCKFFFIFLSYFFLHLKWGENMLFTKYLK